MNSPQKAKEFNEDPKALLMKYGYNGEVNFDDSILKLTMALGDEEINNAIKDNNLKLFYELCADKGIISSSLNGRFSDNFYQDQLQEIYKNKDFQKFNKHLKSKDSLRSNTLTNDNIGGDEDPIIFGVAVLFGMLVLVVGVVVFAAIGFVAAVGTKVAGANGGGIGTDIDSGDFGVIDIYMLKAGTENTYIAVDEYTEDIANNTVSLVKEVQPEYFETVSETALTNFVKINVINNLNKN